MGTSAGESFTTLSSRRGPWDGYRARTARIRSASRWVCNVTSRSRLSGCRCRQPCLAGGASRGILQHPKPPSFVRAALRRWHQRCKGSAHGEDFNAAPHPGWGGFSLGLGKSSRSGMAHLSVTRRRKSRS